MSQDGAAYLLEASFNITEAINMLGWVPTSEETIECIQFAYTVDWTGTYVSHVPMVLFQSAVLEGDPIFPEIWRHLLHSYLGAYAQLTSMIAPLGTD